MKLFCETIFSDTLPAIRAIVTSEMTTRYGMNQMEIAEKLEITQPAVSQYKNGIRGKRVRQLLSDPKLVEWVRDLTEDIVNDRVKLYEKVCEICAITRAHNIYSKKELDPFLCLIQMWDQRTKKDVKASV